MRQVLRKELGLKIVEVGSDTAVVEAGDVLWTGPNVVAVHSFLAAMRTVAKAAVRILRDVVLDIDVKNVFYVFFYFGHVFTLFNVFSKRFFIFEKRWQSSERQAD